VGYTLELHPSNLDSKLKIIKASDGSGPKKFDLGQVSHLWVQKISPKNPIFLIFSIQVKKYLIRLGWKYLGQRRISPLFTVVQKYAWFGAHL